jgi:hypothetical protein
MMVSRIGRSGLNPSWHSVTPISGPLHARERNKVYAESTKHVIHSQKAKLRHTGTPLARHESFTQRVL